MSSPNTRRWLTGTATGPVPTAVLLFYRSARGVRWQQHQLFMGGVEEAVPVSEPVVRALEEANTLRGRGRGPSFAVRLYASPVHMLKSAPMMGRDVRFHEQRLMGVSDDVTHSQCA